MRKITLAFFLTVFCAFNTLAAGDVAISRAIPGKNDSESVTERNENTVTSRSTRKQPSSENKSVVSRSGSRTPQTPNENKTVAKSASNVVSSRSVNNKNVSARPSIEDGVNTVGRNARSNAASINNNAAVRRAGLTLRTSTAEVGGRAMIIGTNKQTGSNIDEQIRNVHSRVSVLANRTPKAVVKQQSLTKESVASAKEILEMTADLNSMCQQQYNECMDQFCAIVDTNQKRCSCSVNSSKYLNAQQNVEQLNIELNDVAQRIRYIGLSADEIRAIMSETEAEKVLSKTKDKSDNRMLLNAIADMLQDPTSGSMEDESGILDLDSLGTDSTEILGLGLNLSFDTSKDLGQKQGAELYNEAVKRCKYIINDCKSAGRLETQFAENYDLLIENDCIAYEQGLKKLNQALLSNINSANSMLQKARLTVAQNKNQYNLTDCIGALETCMTDDMVCGSDYSRCVDPTKRYLDDNGEVVLGQDIAKITTFMQDYDNSIIDSAFIRTSNNTPSCDNDTKGYCIVKHLLSKIGTGQAIKDGGLCRPVLEKCRKYTYYEKQNKEVYNPYNDVVINYIQRAMVNIKAAQSNIITNYAKSCLSELSDCYDTQTSQILSFTTYSFDESTVKKIMLGACRNLALTCAYAVFAKDTTSCPEGDDNTCIESISGIFYSSLLCPANSTYQENVCDTNCVTSHCKCDAGYTLADDACTTE